MIQHGAILMTAGGEVLVLPHVYANGQWNMTIPYIYNGSQWVTANPAEALVMSSLIDENDSNIIDANGNYILVRK